MPKNARKTAAGVVMTAAFLAVAQAASAESTPAKVAISRIRSSSPIIGTLIRDAIERSHTFRQLAETIEASDGLVYVEFGRCPHDLLACLVAVNASGANRLLHARVSRRTGDWYFIGSIAHELRHAIEVLSNPDVTSNFAMDLFFKREGRRVLGAFETDAAIEAGNKVRAEVSRDVAIRVPE
jgi:hypothetical protein